MRLLFAATLFLSAALLFVVQPMVGKMVLPHVGATPAAWTTCMLFFQTALLAGYAYAHLARPRPALHLVVILAASLTLPIALGDAAPPPVGDPTLWLLGRLVVSAGAPFVALSASAPVLQRWFPGDPYPLYAASNAGSLAALIGYPIAVEPMLPLVSQSRWLAIGYVLFVAATAACAVAVRRAPLAAAAVSGPAPGRREIVRWIGLSFVPSSLMVGATTYISSDIAAIPLLWILPLTLYLVSFVVVFARPPRRPPAVPVTAFVLLLVPLFVLAIHGFPSSPVLLLAHLACLFFGALVFHGELVRTRPVRGELTRFYLAMAAGGALGGLWNAIAPLLFSRLIEYPITLLLACFLLPRAPRSSTVAGDRERALLRQIGLDPAAVAGLSPSGAEVARRQRRADLWVPLLTIALAVLAGVMRRHRGDAGQTLLVLAGPAVLCGLLSLRRPTRLACGLGGILLVSLLGLAEVEEVRWRGRSFFAAVRVEDGDPADPARAGLRSLMNGTILHGQQRLDPAHRRDPIAYYHPDGPVGQVFDALRAARPGAGADVAVIGLGVGGLLAYARPADRFTFFEIDPVVERVARDPTLFTWIADSPAPVAVALGDARRSLGHTPAAYDLLVADAFSADSVPMHLITREALALYLSRISAHGLVVFNISSRYLRLEGPLGALARDAGLVGRIRRDAHGARPFRFPSAFVVLARNSGDLGPLAADPRWKPLPAGARPWTDDFSNLLEAIAF